MFKINGIPVEDADFGEALKTVFGMLLDQSIETNQPIVMKASPGIGVVVTFSELATIRGMKFRDVRADCLKPQDVESIPFLNGAGEITHAHVDPLKMLGLAEDDRAVVVITGLENATKPVQKFFKDLKLENKVMVFVEGNSDFEPTLSAKTLANALLSKIGFKL